MDLLDRLLGHDAWTTGELLRRMEALSAEALDRDFDLGHRTLRRTLDHLVFNVEAWTAMLAGEDPRLDRVLPEAERTVAGLRRRLDAIAPRLAALAADIAEREAWDEPAADPTGELPAPVTLGGILAHLITHSMHHRAQAIHMLRRVGVRDVPEGDVLSWESQASRG
jgi:uncharacterized damage-inducible protein DinB